MDNEKKDDLKFSLIMLAVPGGFGLYKVLGGASAFYFLIAAAMLPVVFYFLWPARVAPLRKWWEWLGHKLGVINSTVILTLTYGLLITPIGLLLRLTRRLKAHAAGSTTYWQTPDVSPSTLKDQF